MSVPRDDRLLEHLERRRLLSLTPIATETTVPFPTEMSQFDMAVAGDGSFIVVGDPIEQPGSPDVMAVRYSASGEQVGAPLTLDDRGFNVDVSMDADGDAVVAYQKGSDGVYVVRISKAGVVSAPQRVGTAPDGRRVFETAVSMDDAGGFFVGWIQVPPGNWFQTVELRAFDSSGQPRGAQFNSGFNSDLGSYHNLDLSSRPDGSSAVYALFSSNNFNTIAFWRVTAGGPATVIDGIVGDSFYPDVAVHADGSVVIAYARRDRELLSRWSVFAQRYDANGAELGPEIALGQSLPGTPFNQRIESVAVDALPDGGFIAAFQQETDAGGVTYARRYNAAGESIAGPVVVDLGPARAPVVQADDAGGVVVAYLQGPFTSQEPGKPGVPTFRRLSTAPGELKGADLFVNGTEGNDHIIVERVRERVYVNVNGTVQRFNAADVRFLSISGLGGDDDIVNASALPSTIHGNDGHDTLWGGTGPDRLRGFGGNDVLRGGDGDDVIFGESGDDLLNGGDHNDTLNGDSGGDTLYGSSGRDLLQGYAGSDWLYGEADGDVLDSGFGHNYLEGGAGDDVLLGGGEGDTMFGLAGNDWLLAKDSFVDIVRGGLGDDRASIDEIDDVLAVEEISFEKPL